MGLYFFDVFPIFFLVIFCFVFGFIFFTLIQIIRREQHNNTAPRLTVDVTVVTKRTQVRGDRAHTRYFATFQVVSGDRLELEIPYDRIGYLVEGDRGKLTFQGTRFLSFERG